MSSASDLGRLILNLVLTCLVLLDAQKKKEKKREECRIIFSHAQSKRGRQSIFKTAACAVRDPNNQIIQNMYLLSLP